MYVDHKVKGKLLGMKFKLWEVYWIENFSVQQMVSNIVEIDCVGILRFVFGEVIIFNCDNPKRNWGAYKVLVKLPQSITKGV